MCQQQEEVAFTRLLKLNQWWKELVEEIVEQQEQLVMQLEQDNSQLRLELEEARGQ